MWAFRYAPPAETPLRDELLSSEGLEERALALAARLTIDPNPRRRARDTFPRFEDNVRVLRAAYRTLADDVRRGDFVVSAADWLLDNFYLIASEVSDIRRNLPRTYARGLPTLASRDHAGYARIYAMAIELIRHSDSRLDRPQLIQFLNSYQRVAPLTLGELWAWPSMLKLALIENLRRLADELMRARRARRAADAFVVAAATSSTPAGFRSSTTAGSTASRSSLVAESRRRRKPLRRSHYPVARRGPRRLERRVSMNSRRNVLSDSHPSQIPDGRSVMPAPSMVEGHLAGSNRVGTIAALQLL